MHSLDRSCKKYISLQDFASNVFPRKILQGLYFGWAMSQAAACDGIFYQIPGNSALNPPPGVLPI